MRPGTKRTDGVALIITLSLLVVATILVTGFLVSMRTERQAAQAMANSLLTEAIVQDAMQHATALLDNNIPQPIPPGQAPRPQNWIVSPGLLTKVTGADGTPPQYVPLSTNTDPLDPPTANYVNLNAAIPTASPASYYVDATAEELRAAWVNVLQNPLAPASAANPVVGRYAFWMDDENAKINVNTAYGKPAALQSGSQLYRTNPLDSLTPAPKYEDVGFDAYRTANGSETYPGDASHQASGTVANAVGTSKLSGTTEVSARLYPLWHPSAINLDVLGPSLNRAALADWVFNGVYNSALGYVPNNVTTPLNTANLLVYKQTNGGRYRPLAYPEQIMQFVADDGTGAPADPALYQNNKFNLTAYNRAPEFNAFGKPRLLMENRLRTRSTGSSNDSMGNLGVSGAETEFCQTPDFDANGPTYFHGDDNAAVSLPTSRYNDLGSVQMVADYLSTLLNRHDWPGMPARSFVDKWGGDDDAKREADQVAWNLVSLGTYSSNLENSGTGTQDWPDGQQNLVFMKATNAATPDANGNNSPTLASVSDQPASATTNIDPNRCLRLGKLSGKAIMPFNGRPHVNEVALVIQAVPVKNVSGAFNLVLSLQVELYGGKRCPPASFAEYFDLTHFFYTITGTNGVSASQAACGYSTAGDAGASDGYTSTLGQNAAGGGSAGTSPFINGLGGHLPTTTASPVMPADSYGVLATTGDSGIWVENATAIQTVGTANPPVVPAAAVAFKGTVTVSAKARLALYSGAGTSYRTWELVPVWDSVDCDKPALQPPPGQQDSIAWDFDLDLGSLPKTGATFTRSLEIADARLGGGTHDKTGNGLWVLNAAASDPTVLNTGTIGKRNANATDAVLDLDDYSWLDAQNAFYPNCPRPSIGFLACVPTGMQRGLPSQTLTFGPSTSKTDLPDWLLLDLLAPALQDTLQPVPAPLSYLHGTMGKINVNAQLYPGKGSTRTLPMQALLKNMVPDSQLAPLANNVINHTLSGLDYGAPGQYDYIGELCEVAGVADSGATNWQKETIIRNLANLLTTNSNTFKVYGLAQAIHVTKQAGNTDYGNVETGDTVVVNGEKRFEAVIERGVWPGVDGVPGNAHTAGGVYDQISKSPAATPAPLPWAGVALPKSTWAAGATWAQFDGPDDPRSLRSGNDAPAPGWYGLTYNYSTLKTAVNPARAHMTYRPVSFRYVTN